MKPSAYYNEIDPFAAERLRTHISAGRIMAGEVDERSIEDVHPDDLRGFTQVHFFAGIGVWSYALRRAGWPEDKPVWSGSCPCQPFSAAGKGKGFADERHLWPAMHWLVGQCRPVVIFGEQSASAHANDWIDLVQADMEAMGYAFGACAFPAASVGAPNIRDRTYWVANTNSQQCEECLSGCGKSYRKKDGGQTVESTGLCSPRGVAYSHGIGWQGRISRGKIEEWQTFDRSFGCGCTNSGTGPVNGFWKDADWLKCRDGKWRPIKSGLKPLVNGAAARVGRLRTYGNALNAEAATAFIKAYLMGGQYA
ncbi:DNA cytosine methyltransferase [Salmonella enterica]|uniref:DNA cytosine methyltransferase n=1 Tax=Salmonella enterica TaxID=28901 RepID=UPI00127BE2A6|nr:DNA cytosine methyltransferase [Salmonella enterica]ECI7826026.1 DNA cytosine methyltransferase [Salmonella enterica subsp. enterica]EDR6076772.1 DNA cytosine methyltransferase [Salmonella enterica subsp. enterica serovar Barranquilla]EEM9038119.1 DNA cytosine methyltransferase [Salmonella enterica subsp. enterica serovar Hvittingfoss]EGS6900048.1 DNA cytosine methyltransferase [Salmonella enterica subsp. enterica serovar Chester]HCD0612895.1 DNA cytosine methyltransferase [Salmonella enter